MPTPRDGLGYYTTPQKQGCQTRLPLHGSMEPGPPRQSLLHLGLVIGAALIDAQTERNSWWRWRRWHCAKTFPVPASQAANNAAVVPLRRSSWVTPSPMPSPNGGSGWLRSSAWLGVFSSPQSRPRDPLLSATDPQCPAPDPQRRSRWRSCNGGGDGVAGSTTVTIDAR